MRRRRITVVATLLLLGASTDALAGGMFLPARGARPLGRAGAFVAGADDLGALYYNPAGIAGTAHGSVLFDLGLVFQRVRYDRVDSGGVTLPPVEDNNGLLPIPTLAVSWRPEKGLNRRLTFAFGVFVPYSGVPRYPTEGPQRYSAISIEGTAALIAELAVSIRILPQLYLGLGVQNMFFSLNNIVALSGCTELNCAPEDPGFDAVTETRVSSPITPSGNLGLIYAHPKFRVGASVQGPFYVRARGTVKTKLPTDPQFDGAVVVGDQIAVSLNLPWMFRVGVEVRPLPTLRIEVAGTYEGWQIQDALRFAPEGVYIDRIVGIGRYDLRPMVLDRQMKGVFALHVGGEYDLLWKRLTLRGGYMFESSSMPDETLSVLTPDGDKHLIALGASLRFGKLRIDLGYGHFFQGDRVVTGSRSLQLNPIQPSLAVPVGNGKYAVAADVLSLGLEGRF